MKANSVITELPTENRDGLWFGLRWKCTPPGRNSFRRDARSIAERQAAADRGLRIAQAQYEAGAISSLEATDAERTALAAERGIVSATTEQRLAVVALYKALGGGWTDQQRLSSR